VREDFAEAVEILASKTGVPEDTILDAISKALITAYKKVTKHENIEVNMDKERKNLRIYSRKIVVEETNNPVLEISLKKAKEIKPEKMTLLSTWWR